MLTHMAMNFLFLAATTFVAKGCEIEMGVHNSCRRYSSTFDEYHFMSVDTTGKSAVSTPMIFPSFTTGTE